MTVCSLRTSFRTVTGVLSFRFDLQHAAKRRRPHLNGTNLWNNEALMAVEKYAGVKTIATAFATLGGEGAACELLHAPMQVLLPSRLQLPSKEIWIHLSQLRSSG